jgi:hypothetical protein
MPEAVKEAHIHGTLAGSVRIEWPRSNGLGKPWLGCSLARVKEAEQSHATALPQVDEVPDIKRDALKPQPADGHCAVLPELNACLRELAEEILGCVDLVPQALQPRPLLFVVEEARYTREIGFEVGRVVDARRLRPRRR